MKTIRPGTRSDQGGYIGLLMIFIAVALMVFFIVRTDMFTGNKGEPSVIERDKAAVDSAAALKVQLESNAIPLPEDE